jgi:hypothetical protein
LTSKRKRPKHRKKAKRTHKKASRAGRQFLRDPRALEKWYRRTTAAITETYKQLREELQKKEESQEPQTSQSAGQENPKNGPKPLKNSQESAEFSSPNILFVPTRTIQSERKNGMPAEPDSGARAGVGERSPRQSEERSMAVSKADSG